MTHPPGAADHDPTDDAHDAHDAPPATPPRASRPLILLMENNLGQAEPLASILNLSGYACDIAESIEMARPLLSDEAHHYDLLIADLRLTRPDDADFVRAARAMPRYATLPIIITTGFDSQEARKVGRALHIVDHLLKPVSTTNKLLPLIRRWIGRERP